MDLKLFVLFFSNILTVYSLANVSDHEYDLMPELFHFDDYEKCLFYERNPAYCRVKIKLLPKFYRNTSKIWDIIEKVSADENNYRHDILRHGVCIQNACLNETLRKCLTNMYSKKYGNLELKSEIVEIRCEGKNSQYYIGKIDIVFGLCLCIYVSWVLLISLYTEVVTRDRKRNDNSSNCDRQHFSAVKFFSIFSLFDNWRLLLNPKLSYEKNDYMLFLQGLRFCTIIGVVLTHVLEVNVVKAVQNPRYVEEIPTRYIAMTVANGGMMVQIYFVISAFLFTVSYLKKDKNHENANLKYILSAIVLRYIRLTSMYIIVIGLHSTWFVHLARGPFWDSIMGEDYRVCRKNWWHNILFFNNFVINDGMCMFHSWYLSVDLQFYILGLLILYLTKKKPKILFLVIGALILCHSFLTFFVLFWKNWEIAVKLRPELMYNFGVVYSKEWQSTWTTTYSNLPGLASGLCVGYVYFVYKDKQIFKVKRNKILWWTLSWLLTFAPFLLSSYYMTTDFYSKSRLFAAIYGSFSQVIYTIGCASVIFGMAQGIGGYVKKILEWTPMHVFGQLSFGAYLIHFSLIKIDGASQMLPIYVSDFLMLQDLVVHTAFSYFFSGLLTLFIQIPVLRLFRIFRG